ncbi:MAG: universal stress protein [Acidimicrobiales bacterium]
MYDHIIVPFDGTERAQRASLVGADLGHLLGAELVVMTADDIDREPAIRRVKQRAMDLSDETVTVWVEPMANEAKAVSTMIDFRPNSLICMATSGRTGVRRAAYGSLAERLLHDLDAPILLIGPRWAGASVVDLRHLVVCVDHTTTSEAAIPLAASWAEALPLDATLIHVCTDDDEPPVDLDRLALPLEQRCRIVDKVVVENHDAVAGILDVVQHSISPLVVMATSARGGIDRLLHGSVTASLVSRCEAPVLVQRGPGPDVAGRPIDGSD